MRANKADKRVRFFGLLFFAGVFFLTGCAKDETVVGTLRGKTILTTDALEQEVEKAQRIQDASEPEDFYEEVAQMLLTEALVESDEDLPVDGSPYAEEVRARAVERYGGEEAFLRQLEHFGLTSDEFMDSLTREGERKAHREAYLAGHVASEEDVQKYWKKHRDDCAILTYTEIQLPTLSETKKVVQSLRENPSEAADYESVLNSDLFATTSYARRIDVTRDDLAVRDPEIFEQPLGSIDYFYQSDTQTYLVIWIEGRKDEYADVADNAHQRFDQDRYREELNRLARKYDLRFYPEHIEGLLEKKEGVSSDS